MQLYFFVVIFSFTIADEILDKQVNRDEPKWKAYNDDLKRSKRKGLNQEEGEENSEDLEVVLKRAIGQKAAKKASYAAKYKSKGVEIDAKGKSKEPAIDVDKLDRFSNSSKLMKIVRRYLNCSRKCYLRS